MPVSPVTDLAFSKNGDFIIENGDLKDSTWEAWEGHRQMIRSRVLGIEGDWKLYPGISANLDQEIGKLNTRERGANVVKRILQALTFDGAYQTQNLKVKAVPVSKTAIVAVVILSVITVDNLYNEEVTELFTVTDTEMNPHLISTN